MSQYDQIKKRLLVDSPETVNTDWVSPSTSLDDRAGAFSISLNYNNGISTQMNVYIQLSNDNINFGDVIDPADPTPVQITDPSGTVIFDMDGSGAAFARIRIEVIAGSIDVTEVKYNAAQFH